MLLLVAVSWSMTNGEDYDEDEDEQAPSVVETTCPQSIEILNLFFLFPFSFFCISCMQLLLPRKTMVLANNNTKFVPIPISNSSFVTQNLTYNVRVRDCMVSDKILIWIKCAVTLRIPQSQVVKPMNRVVAATAFVIDKTISMCVRLQQQPRMLFGIIVCILRPRFFVNSSSSSVGIFVDVPFVER